MKIFANHFYNFGFNVTHISSTNKDIHHWNQTVLKSPSHKCEDYLKNRQQLSELHSFDWKNASGLGVILGYNNLRALDIDGCNDIETINHFLSILQLPHNYEWVVKSGSKNGFHILFYCDNHRYTGFSKKIRAFASNLDFKNKFQHIELRWFGHLVLPPSIHPSSNQYQFLNEQVPIEAPSKISLKNLEELIKIYCSENRKITWITSREYIYFSDNSEGYNIDNKKYNHYEGSHYIPYYGENYYYNGIPIECNIPIFDDDFEFPTMYIHNLEDFEIEKKTSRKDNKPYYFFFDTETTGTPLDYEASASNISNWPRIVQIAFISYDIEGNKLESGEYLIKPNNFLIPANSTSIHGITHQKALDEGQPLDIALNKIHQHIKDCKCLVAHNINFDSKVLGAEFIRNEMTNIIDEKEKICTMLETIDFCSIKSEYGNKWPKLSELHFKLFENHFDNAHDAMSDIKATAKCFWELKKRGII